MKGLDLKYMYDIPEPSQKISPQAVKVWRIQDSISNSIVLLILIALLVTQKYFNWYAWIGVALYIIIGLVLLHTIYELTVHPLYLQRTWRYEIDADHIQLKHGFFHKTHIIIPMSRMEYVNTHQGPLLRRYGLSNITIGTIASSHEIPAIPEHEAVKLRNQIVYLAQIENDTPPLDG